MRVEIELRWGDPVCLKCETVHTKPINMSPAESKNTINHLKFIFVMSPKLHWDVVTRETGYSFPRWLLQLKICPTMANGAERKKKTRG